MDAPGRAVYELKISLRGISPPIWRVIQAWEDMQLSELHRAFQLLFNWQDKHLHEFSGAGQVYRAPKTVGVPVNRLLASTGDELEYIYDFGDNWRHRVTLEARLRCDEEAIYPRCMAGERNGPPEDVGGPYAYLEYLRNSPEPASETFSLDRINKSLRAAFPKPVQRRVLPRR